MIPVEAIRTSSHQFNVDVTGLQYPALEDGYGMDVGKDH
jgi:hypothetical protein